MENGEDLFGLAEALALRIFPDHHAFPMKLYVGDGCKLSASGWKDAWNEMMSKPTNISKEAWHAKCQEKHARED